MPPDPTDTSTHPTCTAPTDSLAVTLYVRPNVSAACRRQIKNVQTRLEALADTPLVAETQLRHWPPQLPSADDGDASARAREALVTELERWADHHGHSLQPAIRRKTVPASLLGPDRLHTEICVPIVLLALADADAKTGHLRGVVPYTVDYGTDQATTYTVYDWLTAAEQATAVSDKRQVSFPEGHPRPRS